MKKILLFVLALGVMTSCLKEEFSADVKSACPDFEVIATLDDEATRTQLTSNYKVFWSENDAISVFNYGDHYRYYLESGANDAIAKFKFDPNYGTISGAIDGAVSDEIFVGVYPFSEAATLSMSDNNLVVNTVIPTTQAYSEDSFGQNAAPMIGMPNNAPKFSFKNVGTVLCIPVKADAIITKVTVATENKAIAGATSVTISDEKLNVVATGENKVVLECGEGVQLNKETATNFCVVIAPGVYEANELVIRFYDAAGNYFETTNTNKKDYLRSRVTIYTERVFEEFSGTEEMDLWVKAKAGAYMTAERIIPSVNNLNVEEWVLNLKNQPNTRALIEQAVTYITMKNYEGAFDVLGGVPGFVRDYKDFTATGVYYQKVDYTGASYVTSMLKDIENINDIPSLLEYLNDFENLYEASGIKNKLDESLGSIADNFDTYIDAFVEANYKKPELDNTLSEEEAFAQYKSAVKTKLDESITGVQEALDAIDYIRNGINIWGMEIVAPNSNFMKDEYDSAIAYKKSAEQLSKNWSNLNDKDALDKAISNLNTLEVSININLRLFEYTYNKTIDPASFLTQAQSDYNSYLESLANQILGNEKVIAAAKAAVRSAVAEIQGQSLVESLETAVNEPESTTAKVLNYLFSQEAFMETVKTSLREIVAGIEEASKDSINGSNVSAKDNAISTAKVNALLYARENAVAIIKDALDTENYNNLNNGVWGIFKQLLGWEKTIQFFADNKITDVYDVLVELSKVIDDMITYTRGSIYYDIEEFADYQENVDWWVVTYSQEF